MVVCVFKLIVTICIWQILLAEELLLDQGSPLNYTVGSKYLETSIAVKNDFFATRSGLLYVQYSASPKSFMDSCILSPEKMSCNAEYALTGAGVLFLRYNWTADDLTSSYGWRTEEVNLTNYIVPMKAPISECAVSTDSLDFTVDVGQYFSLSGRYYIVVEIECAWQCCSVLKAAFNLTTKTRFQYNQLIANQTYLLRVWTVVPSSIYSGERFERQFQAIPGRHNSFLCDLFDLTTQFYGETAPCPTNTTEGITTSTLVIIIVVPAVVLIVAVAGVLYCRCRKNRLKTAQSKRFSDSNNNSHLDINGKAYSGLPSDMNMDTKTAIINSVL